MPLVLQTSISTETTTQNKELALGEMAEMVKKALAASGIVIEDYAWEIKH